MAVFSLRWMRIATNQNLGLFPCCFQGTFECARTVVRSYYHIFSRVTSPLICPPIYAPFRNIFRASSVSPTLLWRRTAASPLRVPHRAPRRAVTATAAIWTQRTASPSTGRLPWVTRKSDLSWQGNTTTDKRSLLTGFWNTPNFIVCSILYLLYSKICYRYKTVCDSFKCYCMNANFLCSGNNCDIFLDYINQGLTTHDIRWTKALDIWFISLISGFSIWSKHVCFQRIF